MPLLGQLEEYTVFFYTNEGDLEGLPRVFIRRGHAEAEFLLSQDDDPVILLKRSVGMDSSELIRLRQHIKPIAVDLRRAWNHVFC